MLFLVIMQPFSLCVSHTAFYISHNHFFIATISWEIYFAKLFALSYFNSGLFELHESGK